jgi:hypothetical protein
MSQSDNGNRRQSHGLVGDGNSAAQNERAHRNDAGPDDRRVIGHARMQSRIYK